MWQQLFSKFCVCVLMAAVSSIAVAETPSADNELSFSVGLRAWDLKWQANNFYTIGGKPIAAHMDSSTQLTYIPSVSARYKDFGISYSKLLNSNHTLNDGIQTVSEGRSESDVNFSYFFMPGLSASLGYKEVSWGAVKIKGETLALSASAPIGSGIGIYGTGGIGWLSTLVPTYSNTATDYALGDFGLSYSFNNKPVSLTSGCRES